MTYQCIRQPPCPASGKSYFIIIVVKESYMSSWYDIFWVILFVLFNTCNILWLQLTSKMERVTVNYYKLCDPLHKSQWPASRDSDSASIDFQLVCILAQCCRVSFILAYRIPYFSIFLYISLSCLRLSIWKLSVHIIIWWDNLHDCIANRYNVISRPLELYSFFSVTIVFGMSLHCECLTRVYFVFSFTDAFLRVI